jgi:hypothetical protein
VALVGDLETMPLVELMQWIGGNKRSGVLQIDRDKIRRRIDLRDGRIVGCTSNDPSMRLGQILISRGLIDERILRAALTTQEAGGGSLPDILVDAGIVTREEILKQVASKARETVYALFECDDALFRFEADGEPDPHIIEVDLTVNQVLMEGAARQDELQRIRAAFPHSGVVLRPTESSSAAEPDDPADHDLLSRILDALDGQRTVSDLLLLAHASEFRVLKLLFSLHEKRQVKISEVLEPAQSARTLLDVADGAAREQLPSISEFVETDSDSPPEHHIKQAHLEILLELASDKLNQDDHDGALVILDACLRSRPNDETLHRRIEEIESAFLEQLRAELTESALVPLRIALPDDLPLRELEPHDRSVLEKIDGDSTVQAIVWTTPMRELEVLRGLRRLQDRRLIVFEPAPVSDRVGPV